MPETSRIPNIEHPLVSLIIVNYNGAHFLEPCLRSLATLDYPPARYEVLVVDNGSTDGSAELTQQQFPAVRWVTHTVNNYCRALNVGVSLARGELFAFLNNDTTVDPRWLIELVTVMQQDPRVAMCGSKIRLMTGALNSTSHTPLPNFYWIDRGSGEPDAGQYDRPEDVGSVTGCAVLVQRRALEDVGGWDEDFVMYMEDVDLAHRLTQRGWTIRYVPSSLVYHVLHGTKPERSSEEWTERNRLLFLAKHEPAKLGDALFGRGFFAYPQQAQPGRLLRVMPAVLEKLVKHHGAETALLIMRDLFEQLHKVQNAEWGTLSREKSTLKEQLSDRHAQLQNVIRAQDELTSKLNASRNIVQQLAAQLDTASRCRQVLTTQLETSTQEGERLKERLHETAQEGERLKERLHETDDTLASVSRAREQLAAELSRIFASQTYRWLARPLWTLLGRMKGIFSRRSSKGGLSREKEVLASQNAVLHDGRDEAGRLVGCTIISKNYLAYARVLCRSFLEQHPHSRFFVLLVDELDGSFDPAAEPFELVELATVNIPEVRRLCFQYSIVELNTAVKPYFLTYLFDQQGAQKVVYLDPDILMLKPLAEVEALLDRHWAVLTPHLTSPMVDDGCRPSELTILQAGTFNLGFIALRQSSATRTFLRWWAERLFTKCEMAPERGMHVDQKWIDLVPSFFEGVHILRDPGYNVAYWNLAQRPVTMRDERVTVSGGPCYFVHFSGLQIDALEGISKHQNRLTLNTVGDAAPLFERYREWLIKEGHAQSRYWPYAFGYFDNGVPIPDMVRKLYLGLGDNARTFGDPFTMSDPTSFYQWLKEPVDTDVFHSRIVSRLWHHIYTQRPDVQSAYPDLFGRDRASFLNWCVTSGGVEHNIDERLLPRLDARSGTRDRSRSLVSRLYASLIRPWEPFVKPLMKWVAAASPRTWHFVKSVHYRLNFGPISPGSSLSHPASSNSETFGVNVVGYLTSEKGMGQGVRASMRALSAADIPYEASNIVDAGSENTHPLQWSGRHPYGVNLIHVNADQVPIAARILGSRYFKGRYNIGYWTWELSIFPDEWKTSFSYYNEIWVPSQFVFDAVAPVSPIPVVTIPHAVSMPPIPLERHHARQGKRPFTFLFLFDFMSYWQRKNPFAVIEAFKGAFPHQTDVQLVIKTTHAHFDTSAFHALQRAAQDARVRLIDGVWTREQTAQLLAECDCFVSLHRSEGFGLSLAEAMALGKPVIATGYSGNTEFMTHENSLLVDYTLVELTESYGPYQRGSWWAEPQLDHAVELMRWVTAHSCEARTLGEEATKAIREHFGPLAIGSIVRERLQKILTQPSANGKRTTASTLICEVQAATAS